MRKVSLSLALAVALSAIAVPTRAADSAARAAIDQLNQKFIMSWNAHDAKGMASVWAENGDAINPFGKKATNRADIEKMLQDEQAGVMKASTYKIESFSLRELNDSTAVGDWESVVTGMMDPAGKPLPPFAHHVFVVYVSRGGHWWAAAVRAYPNTPAPEAAAK